MVVPPGRVDADLRQPSVESVMTSAVGAVVAAEAVVGAGGEAEDGAEEEEGAEDGASHRSFPSCMSDGQR
jgi:hypothetical protein